jgi:hypothetical protein
MLLILPFKNMYFKSYELGTVAHACNPSYSGDRDQQDHGLKPAWTNSSRDPISKEKKNHKKGQVE